MGTRFKVFKEGQGKWTIENLSTGLRLSYSRWDIALQTANTLLRHRPGFVLVAG